MSAEEMRFLVDRLNETAGQYYALGESPIADAEWDEMYDRLLLLEKEAGAALPDSPTRRVGSAPSASDAQHKHLGRLWSMDKAKTYDALREWSARAEKLNGGKLKYVVEHKFDGLTINLTYEEGALVCAATRGDGQIGKDVTAQVMTIRSIPLVVPYKGRFEAHGECFMRLSAFDQYNRTAAEPLKSPRNAAAGALGNLDINVTAARRLDASMYGVEYIEGREFADQEDMLAFLRENRFPVSSCERFAEDIEGVIRQVEAIGEEREKLDYMIDGAVIKATDFAARARLGYTDRFPRWAIAFKFEAEEATTRLLDVTWEIGRTGKLTPLAHLEPVELAGATIKRATLNNYQDIVRKDVALGGRVWIRRSNDVIPEITGRAGGAEPGERRIERPTVCPACGSSLNERGAHIFCPNRDGCKPQIVARMTHFASRDAMDIDAFSDKTALQLYEALGLCEPSGLYALSAEALISLERFGELKVKNLLSAIEASKRAELGRFILAIGIPNVGRKTARQLAEKFGSIEGLMAASAEELARLDDVGDIVAGSIVDFFADEANMREVRALLAAGVSPIAPEAREGGALQGMTVVVTGTLGSLTRQEAEALIEKAGGKAGSSVSSKTALVLAGESAGGKLDKAKKLGVRVIDEAEFLKLVNFDPDARN